MGNKKNLLFFLHFIDGGYHAIPAPRNNFTPGSYAVTPAHI
jgi:hypothetical protein